MTVTYINTNPDKHSKNAIADQLVRHQTYKNHEIYAKVTDLMVTNFNKNKHHVYDVYVSVNSSDNYGKELLSGKFDGNSSPNVDLTDVSFVGDIRLDGKLLAGKYIGFTSLDTPPDYSLNSCLDLAFSAIDNVLLLK